MHKNPSNIPLRHLKIKPNLADSDEHKSKNLSKKNLPIDEDYHRDTTIGVPFNWESQPGTPKVKVRENIVPPLTPPPSYFYKTCTTRKSNIKKHSKGIFLKTIFPKVISTSSNPVSLASSSSLSSSTSSTSSWSSSQGAMAYSPMPHENNNNGTPSTRRLFLDSRKTSKVEPKDGSPVSNFRFGFAGLGVNATSGCYASIVKVFLRDV